MDASHQPNSGELRLPPLLLQLVEAGRWPRTEEQFQAQEQVGGRVVLFQPPFATVRMCRAHSTWWNSPEADPDGIDPDLALLVGDHGLVDDSPILLDYRGDSANPRVLYLRWAKPNQWTVMAEDFPAWVNRLGLLSDSPPPPRPPPLPKCVYCHDSKRCYCIRNGAGVSPAGCVRCEGSGKCHVCTERKEIQARRPWWRFWR